MDGSGAGGERRNGGDDGCCMANRRAPVAPLPQELDVLLSKYVLFHTYLLKAVTGLGYLAFTWSTVVLLGGFVTALTKKDFWCITVISLMQAARIFHDLADQLLPNFFKLVTHIISHNCVVVQNQIAELCRSNDRLATVAQNAGSVAFVLLAVLPFLLLSYVPAFLYVYGGPVVCIALAVWRAVQRDYGDDGGGWDSGKANLAPALDMFYSLVLLQGGLLLVWLYHESLWVDHLITLRQHCNLPEKTSWCLEALVEFLCDTRARCWRDLSSIRGRKLVDYAAGLLDSGSWHDNLSGARLLEHFITHQGSSPEEEPTVRSLLLPSRPKFQKLIDALGWRGGRRPEDAEMRKLAARIVAHLADDLHLSQFPGAIQCISYLLQEEATTAYSDQLGLTPSPVRRPASEKEAMVLRLQRREARRLTGRQQHQRRRQGEEVAGGGGSSRSRGIGGGGSSGGTGGGGGSSGGTGGGAAGACNELILQGLVILERLASDRHNCGEICSSPDLLAKITAPLYSRTLVHDIDVTDDWVQVVNASFKVVYQLIHAPGESSTRLRAEIAENSQSMSNLVAIIRQDDHPELQMRAMEILTELALDSSIDLPRETKETLVRKQIHIFLHTAEGDLRATAGRTLALTKCRDVSIFGPLVRILDDKNTKNKYRIMAAEILEDMCLHCDNQRVKEILLPTVLSNIMPPQTENRQSQNSALRIPEPGQDVENQNISTQRVNTQIIQETRSSRHQNMSSDQGNEGQTATKALQAKLLSLTLVMYVNNIETEDFDNALLNNGSDFVVKLRTMIEDSCRQATVGNLSIVKLCGQIAVSMMQRNQYTEVFKHKKFVESLSKAREIMSNLESCVLFAGRDHGLRTMARPLLLDLENEAKRLVG